MSGFKFIRKEEAIKAMCLGAGARFLNAKNVIKK